MPHILITACITKDGDFPSTIFSKPRTGAVVMNSIVEPVEMRRASPPILGMSFINFYPFFFLIFCILLQNFYSFDKKFMQKIYNFGEDGKFQNLIYASTTIQKI